MNLPFPDKLPLARLPTPFEKLSRVSQELGVDVWIKRDDLTDTIVSGNKIRKLEYVLAQALAEGCDTLITCGGLQSNHCRATAAVGAKLGLTVSLILRGPAEGDADGNLLLGSLFGAQVDTYSKPEDLQRLPQLMEYKAEAYRAEGKKPFIIPIGASDGIGVWGYISAALELTEDFIREGIHPESIVCASGSGGTQAGLIVGTQSIDQDVKVLGMAVCDDVKYFNNKIREDVADWSNRYQIDYSLPNDVIHVNDQYIGPGYAKADKPIFQTIQWLAQLEGVLLDPVYTGKAFHGMVQEIKAGRLGVTGPVVFIHTGGAFGVFPYREHFQTTINNF